MQLRTTPVTVHAPASSANLGPGFDACGLALDLCDEVTAQVAGTGVHVAVTGEGADTLPTDGRHLVASALRAGLAALGVPAPGLRLRCRNAIPQARGLGSSSASIVAGLVLARALVPGARWSDAALLRLASELEGHPDNVAACLLGGLTLAWRDAGGAQAVRLSPHPALRPVVYVPAAVSLTADTRAALPARVPHADAAFTAGRAALLVHALTQRPDLAFAATEDRLHQPYRAAALPAAAALVADLRAHGVAAVLSGAGPGVLALSPVPAAAEPGAPWRRLTCAVGG
ncbi:MAG TPA: homoserine kinase, partial [Pilimelia sp.]|nr:homoserine kinase [Pilimelia sp.]